MVIVDRDRAVGVRLAGPRRSHDPGLQRHRRRRRRLRRAPDAGQRRSPGSCWRSSSRSGSATSSPSRARPGPSRTSADLHLAAHRRRRAAGDPQRAPRRRDHPQRLDPLADRRDRGLGLAAARRRRGPRAGGARAPSTASAPASPRSTHDGLRLLVMGEPGPRQSAWPARPTCAPRRSAPLRERGRALTQRPPSAEGSRRRARIHSSRAPGRRPSAHQRTPIVHVPPRTTATPASQQGRPRARPLPRPRRARRRRRSRRARRASAGSCRSRPPGRRWTRLKPQDQGAASVDLRRRRHAARASSATTSCARRSPAARSRRSCATRRSRSRTGASSTTRASTSRASSAPPSRTWSPRTTSRAARR